MLKSLALLSFAAAVSAANAQSIDPATPPQQPAPVVRSYQQHRPLYQQSPVTESQPTAGVWLRSESKSALSTVTATPQRTEIRLDHGRLNVTIHQPSQHSEILIDLPGGQISLLKDGLYTFNADTNTVRVLRGEAAYVGQVTANATSKAIKIKEDHQISLSATTDGKPGEVRSVESYRYELTADLLPLGSSGDRAYSGSGDADGPDYPRYENAYPYYAGAFGYYSGFYPGYYGFGYPFSYGIGLGYYGGFRGGFGSRGGFRR